jgi:hypothetical protein
VGAKACEAQQGYHGFLKVTYVGKNKGYNKMSLDGLKEDSSGKLSVGSGRRQ